MPDLLKGRQVAKLLTDWKSILILFDNGDAENLRLEKDMSACMS